MASTAAAEAIRNIIEAHKDGIDAGYELQQRKINTILTAYEKALTDESARIPTALHAAIEAARGTTPDVPMTTTRRGAAMTEYRLLGGSLESVQFGIRSIFDTYDPRAYGTRVNAIEMNGDGHYEARMSRSNSCE